MKRLLRLARTPFARDSAILQGSGLTIAALQLFSTVAMANLIGDVEQGTYFIALAVYGLLFMLMNTGVMQATVVQLASGAAAADTEQVAAWQAFLVKLYLMAGVLLVGVGWFALPWGAEVFLHDREAGELALMLTALPFLELPRVVAQATFQSVRRMQDLAKLELINEVGRVALVVGLAASFGDARGPVLGTTLAGAVGSVVGVVLYRRAAATGEHKFPSIRAILARVRDVPIRRGLWLGVRVGALRSIDAITVQVLPPLIIASAGGLAGRSEDLIKASVAHFRIAQRVVQVPLMLLQGISRTTIPALSQMAGRRDAEGFRRAWYRVTAISGAICVGGMLLVILARPLLPALLDLVHLPETYHGPVSRNIPILAIGAGIVGFSAASEAFYVVADRLRAAIAIAGIMMWPSIGLTYLFSYRLPETGAAWGVTFTYSVAALHVTYALLYFRSSRHATLFQPRREPSE